MILFRKLYKEANDNIKVDEALLEKTLETAFSSQLPKRKYNFAAISSVAAAVVVAIGCGMAYPTLINKPAIDGDVVEIIVDAEPTAVSEALIDVPMAVDASAQKPVEKTPKTTKAPTSVQQPAVVSEAVEAVPMSRMGDEGIAARVGSKLPVPESYEQVACVFGEDGSESYVFEGENDKVISVVITPGAKDLFESESAIWTQTEEQINVTFQKEDITIDIDAKNMTREEVEEIFGDYIKN